MCPLYVDGFGELGVHFLLPSIGHYRVLWTFRECYQTGECAVRQGAHGPQRLPSGTLEYGSYGCA